MGWQIVCIVTVVEGRTERKMRRFSYSKYFTNYPSTCNRHENSPLQLLIHNFYCKIFNMILKLFLLHNIAKHSAYRKHDKEKDCPGWCTWKTQNNFRIGYKNKPRSRIHHRIDASISRMSNCSKNGKLQIWPKRNEALFSRIISVHNYITS